MKKTILHFIYDLGRGGAETMLVRVVNELPEYNNVIVTVRDYNHLGNELKNATYICLKQKWVFLFPLNAFRLRKIIKQHKVDLVHTHLFWPTFIARLGVPKKIPLITTIHAFIATSVEYKKWIIRFLDSNSFRLRRSVIIGVADGATREYFSFLGLRAYKAYSLYTFVDLNKFNTTHVAAKKGLEPFRVISIGALRLQKNHQYLVEAFKLIKDDNIELDIYGQGPLQQELQHSIDAASAKVTLKGQMENIEAILPLYDLCVMSSTFEGFSLGVLETMAAKVPLLLSDIVSFREQCEQTAVYFSLQDVNDFVAKLRSLVADEKLRLQLSEEAYKRVTGNFTLEHHMGKLREIYIDTLNNN